MDMEKQPHLKTINEYIEFETNSKKILSIVNFKIIFEHIKNSYDNQYVNVYIIEPTMLSFEEELAKIIDKAIANKDRKYIILCQNTDTEMPPVKCKFLLMTNEDILKYKHDEIINKSLIDTMPNNLIFFGYSISYTNYNKNIYMIPLGREINQLMLSQDIKGKTMEERTILCYLNCGIIDDNLWYGNERRKIYEWAKNTPFITIENCENIKDRKLNWSMYNNYYKKIASSKFILCPRNKTTDTYRIWDAIYLGCIPIVILDDGFKQFIDLPILFINSYAELFSMTEEQLNNIWFEYIGKRWNYNILNINYWTEYINDIISK